MIDIGVNLFSAQFEGEHDQLLAQAYAAGVQALIITGTDLANSRQALDFCQQPFAGSTQCFATAGVHPHHASEVGAGWLKQLQTLAEHSEVVALGEMGLDYFRNFSEPAAQRRCFSDQVSLAQECQLPLFVHDRDASKDTLKILQQELLGTGNTDLRNVVIHCFTGTKQALEAYLEAGCYIGITGWVCDRKRGQQLRELVPSIPLSRLLVETDAPYLRPQNAPAASGKHKRRNTPALLPYVVSTLAELMQVSESQIQQHSTANAKALFRLELATAQATSPDLRAPVTAQPAQP